MLGLFSGVCRIREAFPRLPDSLILPLAVLSRSPLLVPRPFPNATT